MAGKSHARRPAIFVDLTLDSDSENENEDQNQNTDVRTGKSPRRETAKDNIQNDGYMTSNHGLPDPEEFKPKRALSRAIKPLPNTYKPHRSPYILQSGVGTPGSGHKSRILPGSQDHLLRAAGAGRVSDSPPILPTTTLENWRTTSVNNSQGYGAQGASSSTPSQPPNRAQIIRAQQQLLKTGKSSPVLEYTLSRPVKETTQRNDLRSLDYMDLDEQEAGGVTYSPINPTTQPSSRKRQKLDIIGRHAGTPKLNSQAQGSLMRSEPPPILPPAKTVITGASRAGESEVPRNSYPVIQGVRGKRTATYADQIPFHVRMCLLKYGSIIPEEQRKTLVEQVSASLVDEPKFKKHLLENNNVLSPEFEQSFAQILETRFRNAARLQTDRNALQPAGDVVMFDVQPHIQEQSYPTPETVDSPDSEQVFEDAQVLKPSGKFTESRFRDDSSPATSLSVRAGSRNQSEDKDVEPVAQKSGRVTRGAKVDYYAQNPLRQARRMQTVAGPSKQIGESSRSRQSNQHNAKNSNAASSSKRGGLVVASHFEVPDNAIRPRPILSLEAKLGSMFRQRELYGMSPARPRFGQTSYKTLATNALEDSMVRDWRWTSQSSDVVTITWTGPSTFFSGALAHYDVHNMQYNRHGNLVVGSTASRIVKMVDGHRTLRPIVTEEENKENSLPAMRATQDKWRYAPVVSSAYCQPNGYAFTGSFDKTVKIWKILGDGEYMELKGTWEHDCSVNFVVTSKHHDKVATASEGQNDAIRVYSFDEKDISRSAYDVYNAHRASTKPGDERMAEKWAYHPATIQWGVAPSVANLLLVGYSPRGDSLVDETVPDTKKNTGELCCWNADTGEQVPINAGHSQNVFEVLWHPTQPIFLVASAPSGTFDPKKTKTQVRLFQLQGTGSESFQCLKTLDCPASDINEITMRPTSIFDGYVTASCTDGKTYVWDTMLDDRVLHVLPHGESIDNPDPDIPLEQADTGVKFAAWGQSNNRFYTGSSDGVVKVWDITQPPEKVHVRNLLEAQGGISSGSFSSDYSQILIGDGTGCIHLVQSPADEVEPNTALKPGTQQYMLSLRRMGAIVPHDSEPAMSSTPDENLDTSQDYIAQGILSKFPMDIPGFENRHRIGQGPNYDWLKLYNDGLHVNGDHSMPVLPDAGYASNWDTVREVKSQQVSTKKERFPVLKLVRQSTITQAGQRQQNDLNVHKLIERTHSLHFKQDIEISAEHALSYVDERDDFVPDE